MADNDFRNAFAVAYADGPSSGPFEPNKAVIRAIGTKLDAALAGLSSLIGSSIQWKEPVAVATTANITLSGEQTIDGVLTSGSRILVKNQTTPSQNGIYVTGAGAWSRAADADSDAEVKGMAVFVRGGTVSKGKQFVCIAVGAIVLGSTALPFIEISDQTALNAAISDLQAAQTIETAARRAIDAKVPDLVNQKGARLRYVTGTRRTDLLFGSNFFGASYQKWGVGIKTEQLVQNPAAVGFYLIGVSGVDSFGMRMVRRPFANANGVTGGFISPGDYVDDIVLQDWNYVKASDVMGDPVNASIMQLVTLPILPTVGPLDPNFVYFAEIVAKNSAGANLTIGVAQGAAIINDAVDPFWRRGQFASLSTGGTGPVSVANVAYSLFEAEYVDGSAGTEANATKVSIGLRAQTQQSTSSGSNWVVTIPTQSVDVQPGSPGTDRGGNVQVPISKPASGLMRYDDIVLDPDTGVALVATGTARQYDANEYKGSNEAFPRAYTVLSTPTGAELIKTGDFDGFCRRGQEAKFLHQLTVFRSRLPKLMRRLRRGQSIRYVSYGDSNGAIGGGNAMPYEPNGPNRDIIEHLINYPSDTLAGVPRYDGDGGVGAHVRIGTDWVVKAAMEECWGSVVEYLNMCIAGTKSDNSITDGIGPNGLYPARLAALIALAPDVVHIRFGMNEFASSTTYANHVGIITQLKAAGIDVIVSTPPRPNSISGGLPYDWWLYTTRQVIRAAEECKVAWSDWSRISAKGNEGAIGIASTTMCDANGNNHIGLHELGAKGYGGYSALPFTFA